MADEQARDASNEEVDLSTDMKFVHFPRKIPEEASVTMDLVVEEERERNLPKSAWMVYAVVGGLIIEWLWYKWKQRKAKRDDDEHSGS